MVDGNSLYWGAAHFYPLAYQSRGIGFEEWISLLTLCLAPLIAHVASGAPCPSYISKDRPRWHDQICHFNPTSILFRYAAISDRRIRALKWDNYTMAATNALFWTGKGWDGSEEMLSRGFAHCAHMPEHSRVKLLSWEMAKTVIITLQGAQPFYCLVCILIGSMDVNTNMAMDGIFPSLAILGLLRLCAAMWLTGDFVYTTYPSSQSRPMTPTRSATIERSTEYKGSFDSLLDPEFFMPAPPEYRFHPPSYWPSRVFRAAFLIVILALAVLCTMFLVPWSKATMYTTTSLMVGMMNIIYLAASILSYGYYSFRGTSSTIIPCISSLWYKIYTIFLMTFMIALVIISAIETRETPCGKYTSLPGEVGDIATCVTPTSHLIPVHPGSGQWFGLVSGSWANGRPQISTQNFTGSCIGSLIEGEVYNATVSLA
ncbi:uncharacterized protein F4822DRAFT_345042 [Hypoxylon trugodes]|uniref:uncharacterized protein n=1 Tax=Hypoxylon trugodes TaxID=326681 RepID=UPI00219C1385|nr:uncharacterized protein F4822DRAFT_345042 [Hypoxylon trugodes]KAI1385461.1 hypothetical protein F4822DRAFT_345042 [Hypoxylon trugodes]